MAKTLDILQSLDEIISPVTALPRTDDSAIEWRVVPNKGWLLSPRMNLHLHVTIKKDGVKLKEEDAAALLNYALMTMWKTAEVEIGQQRVTANNSAHAFVSYLMALREFNQQERHIFLRRSLWAPDSANAYNRFEKIPDVGYLNQGFAMRMAIAMNYGGMMDLFGPLMIDILRQNQPFSDEHEVIIRLTRASNKFVINANQDNEVKFDLAIHKADLSITRLRYASQITEQTIFNIIGPQLMYKYPGYETRHYVIPTKVTSVSMEIYDGSLPQRIFLMQLSSEAVNGSYRANPMEIGHYNLKNIVLQINNNQYLPAKPYDVDIDGGVFSRIYMDSITNVGTDTPYTDFLGGRFIMAFDLRRDRETEEQTKDRTPVQIRVNAEYEEEINKPMILMCILEFCKILCVKATGQVMLM